MSPKKKKKKSTKKNVFARKRIAKQKVRDEIANDLLGVGDIFSAKFRIHCAAIQKSFNYETNVFGLSAEEARKNAEDCMKEYADNYLDRLGIPSYFRVDCECLSFGPLAEQIICERNDHGRWVASYKNGGTQYGPTEEEARENLRRYLLTRMMPKNLGADQEKGKDESD